jgi:hypothetical protein
MLLPEVAQRRFFGSSGHSGGFVMRLQYRTTELARTARELALSGKHQDHFTVLARLSHSHGFTSVQAWAQNPLIRLQLDGLCREARKRMLVSEH